VSTLIKMTPGANSALPKNGKAYIARANQKCSKRNANIRVIITLSSHVQAGQQDQHSISDTTITHWSKQLPDNIAGVADVQLMLSSSSGS
jgi:hypothetical protein